MENTSKSSVYCRVNSFEQLYSISPGSKILRDYLKNIPKVYEKNKYDQKCIQGIRAAIYYHTFGESNIDNFKVAKLKNYAKKYNFTINTFIDYESNAIIKCNCELEKILKMINEEQLEVLIVYSLRNISKNIKTVAEFLQIVEEKNIHLINLNSL